MPNGRVEAAFPVCCPLIPQRTGVICPLGVCIPNILLRLPGTGLQGKILRFPLTVNGKEPETTIQKDFPCLAKRVADMFRGMGI